MFLIFVVNKKTKEYVEVQKLIWSGGEVLSYRAKNQLDLKEFSKETQYLVCLDEQEKTYHE